jgi:hypothetical protein
MRGSKLGVNNIGSVQHGQCINLGEIQHMNFRTDNLPPVLKPFCPKFSTPTGKTITRELNVPEMKARLEAEKLNSDGKRQVLFERCIEVGLPVKLTLPVMTPGYVVEPKGAALIAFERVFFNSSVTLLNGKKVSFAGPKLQEVEAAELNVASAIIDHHKKREPKVKQDKERSLQEILKHCEDFATKHHSLNLLLKNIYWPSSASHPSVISKFQDWGYWKLRFCRGINDAVASHLEENVKAALSREVLTIKQIHKFAGNEQDYKLTYLLHWQMARMPLQLRIPLNTAQSCLNSMFSPQCQL